MIRSLTVSNYALISNIEIDFSPGLDIITGETGAGKSILLGALSLLLGGRADTKVIADTSKKSVIEAVFDASDASGLDTLLADNDIDADAAGEVILRRELSPSGRSRAFVNDTPVNLTALRDIAVRLVDIHSQHQNMLLSDNSYQLAIIDSLADNRQLLAEYHKAYEIYKGILREYTATRDMIRRNRDDADFISYQLDEIKALSLVAGEQEALEEERTILENAGTINRDIAEALDALDGEESGALSALSRAASACNGLADKNIDDISPLAERLESALIEVGDIARTLRDYESRFRDDPGRLEAVEDRLGSIYSLELKHHVDDSDALIELGDMLAHKLEAIENGDAVLEDLENRAKAAKRDAMMIARTISAARQTAARSFAAALEEEARPLGMKNLRCTIALTPTRLSPTGIDAVEFLFAFNKNSSPLPVRDTASGGEISRLMLVIKTIVGRKMQLPTIIFDEIDTGVSGDIASRIGMMMSRIAENIQVITITHLPQVAARGTSHYKVYKEDNETSTETKLRRLDETGRVDEIALMLSGDSTNAAARETARVLLSATN